MDALTTTGEGKRRARFEPTRVQRLAVVHAAQRPAVRVMRVPADGLPVGRSPGPGGFLLNDPGASRLHLRVESDGRGGWQARDLDSLNGLVVDGAPAARTALRHGSVLRVSGTLLVFLDQWVGRDDVLAQASPLLVGDSVEMQRVRGQLARLALRSVPVRLDGPAGSDQDAAAAELHRLSARRGRFIAVDAAEVGALSDRLREAAGGTLFLRGIEHLPAELRDRLLRGLPGSEADTLDVRVVVSGETTLGTRVELPPLVERRDDILQLAERFAAEVRLPFEPSLGAAEALLLHDWPGDVQELREVVTAAVVRAAGAPVRSRHLSPDLAGGSRRDR